MNLRAHASKKGARTHAERDAKVDLLRSLLHLPSVPRSLLTLASIAGLALGCAYATVEPVQAQRATPPSVHPAPAHEEPGIAVGIVAPAVAAPLVALDANLFPVYPPSPLAYPIDADGHPVYGLDIGIEDLTGTSLRAFHAALRRAERGEGQARIVAYGASHIASDSWTGTVRRGLQTRFGDAGHGFILPVEPWRSYHHQDIAVDSTLRLWQTLRYHAGQAAPLRFGLAGVAVESSEMRAWGRIETGERTCSRFEIYYEQQPMGGGFDVLIDGQVARQVSTNAPQAMAAYEIFSVADSRHTFEVRPRGDGPVRIYGVAVEREAPGVVLDTLGINGARAASQLYWDEALWQEHMRRRVPDLVILAYGTNESGDDEQPIATYEANMRQVVERVQRTVPLASCLLVGPSDRPVMNRDRTGTMRLRTLEIIAAQRRVARDYGCGFFDLVAWGGGPMHMMEWSAAEPAWALRDHVHFTPRAYRRLGEVITNALLQTY